MSLIKDVRTDVKSLDYSAASMRKFGYTFGAVLLLISVFIIYKHTGITVGAACFSIAAIAFMVPAAVRPMMLVPAYRAIMYLSLTLGWVISRVLLIVIFYLLITPTGLIMRVFGMDLLDMRFRDNRNSYWKPKKHEQSTGYNKLY